MNKIFNILYTIIKTVITLFLLVMVVVLIMTTFSPSKKFRVERVMSGSMEPTLPVGAAVLVQQVNPVTLKTKDIITFNSINETAGTITHRINSIVKSSGNISIITKGDVNSVTDVDPVKPNQIQGKVILMIPYLGYISAWMRTPKGFLLLVILPAAFIIISEIWNIKKAMEESITKKIRQQEAQRI